MITELFDRALPSDLAVPFWHASSKGRLALQTCSACRRLQHPPKPVCASCGGVELVFEPVSGIGTVYSYTTVHRALVSDLESLVPYTLGLVDLEEGPRMMALLRLGDGEPAVGMQVQVGFERVTDDFSLPVFTPRD